MLVECCRVVLCGYTFMCYCYVRMSWRNIKRLNRQLRIAVGRNSRDGVEGLLDLGADVDACSDEVCY